MRETLDGFQGGLQIGGQILTNLRYTDEWVLNKAGGKRELVKTVKARKLAYYGHTHH